MDPTLRAILTELFAVSVELDRVRKRVAELEAQLESREKEQPED